MNPFQLPDQSWIDLDKVALAHLHETTKDVERGFIFFWYEAVPTGEWSVVFRFSEREYAEAGGFGSKEAAQLFLNDAMKAAARVDPRAPFVVR